MTENVVTSLCSHFVSYSQQEILEHLFGLLDGLGHLTANMFLNLHCFRPDNHCCVLVICHNECF